MSQTPPTHRYDTRAPERRAELAELRKDVRTLGEDVRSDLSRWREEQRATAVRDAADRAAHLAELRRSTDEVRASVRVAQGATHDYLNDVRAELRESAASGRQDRAAYLADLKRYAAELERTLAGSRADWALQRDDRLRAGRERREELVRAFDPAPRIAWLERYREDMATAREERLASLEQLRRDLVPILRPWTVATPDVTMDALPTRAAPSQPIPQPPKRKPVRTVDPLTALIGMIGRTPGITRSDLREAIGLSAKEFDGMLAELLDGDVVRLRDGHYYLASSAPDDVASAEDDAVDTAAD